MDSAAFDGLWLARWAAYIGCAADDLKKRRALPLRREDWAEPMLALTNLGAALLCEYSAPEEARLRPILAKPAGEGQTGTGALMPLFDDLLLKAGYAFDFEDDILALNPARFRPAAVPGGFSLRRLTPQDAPALKALQQAAGQEAAGTAKVEADDLYPVGCFRGDALVCAASLIDWRGFADPGILTHPAFRGKGLGKAAVSALCRAALDGGQLCQYRCGKHLPHSRAIALALGFEDMAAMRVYIRPA